MMSHDEIAKLSAAERLALISDLWDSVADEDTPLPQPQREELVLRLATLDGDKAKAVSWDALKADLNARKR